MSKTFLVDLAERVASTFGVAFFGLLVSSGFFSLPHITDVSIVEKAAMAGVAAVLSLLKGLVAKWVSSPTLASFAGKTISLELRKMQ